MANLLENYKQRIQIAESVYGKAHAGSKMDNQKKLVLAKLLDNTNKFLREAIDSSAGTQRSDMGLFMKFSMNLTTVGIPY